MSYWNQKLEKVKTEMEKQILEKQIKEVEREIEAIKWEVFFLCSWWKWKSILDSLPLLGSFLLPWALIDVTFVEIFICVGLQEIKCCSNSAELSSPQFFTKNCVLGPDMQM